MPGFKLTPPGRRMMAAGLACLVLASPSPTLAREDAASQAQPLSLQQALERARAGELDEAQAREQEARAELTELRRQARVEARSAHAEWQAQVAGWDQAEAAVAEAAEALDQTFGRYTEGLDDITDLLRAQAEDLAARTREINARFNALVAAERYQLAIGASSAMEIQP